MEMLCRDWKQEYDSEFGGGRVGTFPPLWRTCDVQSVPAYHRVSLGALPTLAVSGRVVFGLRRTAWITCEVSTTGLN